MKRLLLVLLLMPGILPCTAAPVYLINSGLQINPGISEQVASLLAQSVSNGAALQVKANGGTAYLSVDTSTGRTTLYSLSVTSFGAGAVKSDASGVLSVGSYNLDDLGDVTITSPTDGKVLKYNGTTSQWEVGTDLTGGGGAAAWGNITGVLSAQTDLSNALGGKVDTTRTLTIAGATGISSSAGAQDLSLNRTWTLSPTYGTAINTITQGNDSRLSDSRTPTAHTITSATYHSGWGTAGTWLKSTGTAGSWAAVTWADVDKTSSSLADLATRATGNLSDWAAGIPTNGQIPVYVTGTGKWTATTPGYEPANANIQAHIASTANPHAVTKAQVGLGNVLNVTQEPALAAGTTAQFYRGDKGWTNTLVGSLLIGQDGAGIYLKGTAGTGTPSLYLSGSGTYWTMGGDGLIAAVDNVSDLGISSLRFRDLNLGRNAVVGNASSSGSLQVRGDGATQDPVVMENRGAITGNQNLVWKNSINPATVSDISANISVAKIGAWDVPANKSASMTFQVLTAGTLGDRLKLDSNGAYLPHLTAGGYIKGAATTGLLSVGAIAAADLPTGIDATKLGSGLVDNTELSYLDGVTSALQTQLNGKVPTSRILTAGSGLTGGGDLSLDRSFAVSWGGNGAAVTASRSDHSHTGTYEPVLAAGTTAQFYRGDKTWSNTLVGSLLLGADGAGIYLKGSLGTGTPSLYLSGSLTYWTMGGSGLIAALDNTADLGIPGFGFRDLKLGRNALVGGTLGVTGTTTLGALTGILKGSTGAVGTVTVSSPLAYDTGTGALSLTQTAITNVNSALMTGLLKVTTGTGALSVASAGTDYEPALAAGTTAQVYRGDKSWSSTLVDPADSTITTTLGPGALTVRHDVLTSNPVVMENRAASGGFQFLVWKNSLNPATASDVSADIGIAKSGAWDLPANKSASMTFQVLTAGTLADRLKLDSNGAYLPHLTAGGYIKGAATTGLLSVGAIAAADLPTGIDATKLGGGLVDNTELSYLDGVTSPIQTQINGKSGTGHTHAFDTLTATADAGAKRVLSIVSSGTIVSYSRIGTTGVDIAAGDHSHSGMITGTFNASFVPVANGNQTLETSALWAEPYGSLSTWQAGVEKRFLATGGFSVSNAPILDGASGSFIYKDENGINQTIVVTGGIITSIGGAQ